MRRLVSVLAALAALGATPPSAAGADRYTLANGCWTLGAPGGAVAKDGGGYRAGAGDPEAFRLKATALGRYMLYGRGHDFLAAGAGAAVEAAGEPGPEADWTVDVAGDAYTLVNVASGRALGAADGRLVQVAREQAGHFSFTGASGCAEFPEVETSTTGEPRANPIAYGETRGLMDLHLHLMAFEFLGGRAHCGRPWSPYGVTVALVDCPDHYPGEGGAAVLENVLSYGNPARTHDPVGWPTFKDWPHHQSLTHEQTYYRWVERAWRGGLRLMTVLLVDNAVLCELYPYKQNSCNEMDGVRLQARRLREFEDYVDAQNGGPGKGWFRIVADPFEARRVINAGKLAVVPGIEVSKLFDCGEFRDQPECDRAQIDRQLDEVHELGVRQMEIVNKFDNALTGVAGDSGTTGQVTNSGNFYETGHYWAMKTCTGDAHQHDKEQTVVPGQDRDPLVGNLLRSFLPADAAPPLYPPPPHCNQRGLTPLGAYLLRRMAEKGMIFDPDHMSAIARDQALTVMESLDYSGVVSSHSWSSPDALPRIYALGGTISPHEKSTPAFVEAWKQHKALRDRRYYWGIGYGTDQNGFATQAGPREGNAENPVAYPFKSFDGAVTLDRQRSGERVFDINADGVAHYGLYPDLVEDLRTIAGEEIVADLARGPESFLQMWERAAGIDGERCRPRGGRFDRHGLRGVRIGATPVATLRAAGQPVRRTRVWRWCVKRARGEKVVAVRNRAGRIVLVGSTRRAHQARGIWIGDRARRLRARGGRRALKGVYTRDAGKGRAYVYGVRKGRVSFTAVTTRKVAAKRARLRANLRRAKLR